ncbi:3820_t:CDS:1 [Acaulospora morrowiae]|uniref:3820_t:CDS:1 n=1 Tax=Acaulospora morrowiae TaxID=94023 RepID=A0A9N9EZ09_9GLOM|nr:3820_t:CDS:1 [Acaulospora morrowiae]
MFYKISLFHLYAIIALLLSIAYVYVAIKDYPRWRRNRNTFFTHSIDKKPQEVRPETSPLLFIPFIPFAVVYFTLRLAWDAFRLFVFHSLEGTATGAIMLVRFLIQFIKKLPDMFVAIKTFWNKYIQHRLLRTLSLCLEWTYVYIWPVVKNSAIIGWSAAVEGRKILIRSWHRSLELSVIGWNEFLYPSLKFLSWVFVTFIIEPGKWIFSRTLYLSRIAWYCTCLLARDLAEDARDLWIMGYKVFAALWKHIINPAIHMTHEFYEKGKRHIPIIGRFLYSRFILATINDFTNTLYGICSDPTFRFMAEYVYSVVSAGTLQKLISSHLKIMIPIFVRHAKRCGFEIVEGAIVAFRDTVETLILINNVIILPAITTFIIVKNFSNKMYRHVKEHLVNLFNFMWKVFVPLLKPVISILSFIYTTFILKAFLAFLRFSKWAISLTTTALSYAWIHSQETMSFMYKCSESIYLLILPYVKAFTSVINDKMIILMNALWSSFSKVTTFILETFWVQTQAFRSFCSEAYVKYEPVIADLKQRVVETADSMVVSAGQMMMEWTKRERELRRGFSSRDG